MVGGRPGRCVAGGHRQRPVEHPQGPVVPALRNDGRHGTKTGAEFSLGDWQAGQAYHITASWDGGNMLLYVDGKLVARQHYTNQFGIPPEAPVFIGSDPGPAPIAPGSLRNLQLSQEALGPGDVAVGADPALPKTN